MSSVLKAIEDLKREVQIRRDAKDVTDRIDVTEHIAPIYLPLHEDIQNGAHQNYNLPGGRGSGKSSFCALEIVSGIMKDQTGEENAIVFRRTGNTMRESVYSQIAWAIDVLNVNDLWRGSVSPMNWTYKPTGAQIIFRGLDDSSKLKSIKPRHGYFRYIWLEEFSELPGENFTRAVLQSVLRGGNRFTVFRSFNPPINANNWANVFVQVYDDKAITLHTTYKDVPSEWLGSDFIDEAERLREVNENAYRHEYLGEAIGSGGEVFPNIEVRAITDEEISLMGYFYAGIDFGFSVDPSVFILASYDTKRDTLYIVDEIYQKHCSNKDLADIIRAKGYDIAGRDQQYVPRAPWQPSPDPERQLIFADCAEPKSINDLQNEGLYVRPCHKFPGCVLYRIKWLQNRRIVIDPKRTPNAHREFVNYEYMTTKDGEFLADVPDKDNHCIDATSYALDRLIYHKGVTA